MYSPKSSWLYGEVNSLFINPLLLLCNCIIEGSSKCELEFVYCSLGDTTTASEHGDEVSVHPYLAFHFNLHLGIQRGYPSSSCTDVGPHDNHGSAPESRPYLGTVFPNLSCELPTDKNKFADKMFFNNIISDLGKFIL